MRGQPCRVALSNFVPLKFDYIAGAAVARVYVPVHV